MSYSQKLKEHKKETHCELMFGGEVVMRKIKMQTPKAIIRIPLATPSQAEIFPSDKSIPKKPPAVEIISLEFQFKKFRKCECGRETIAVYDFIGVHK